MNQNIKSGQLFSILAGFLAGFLIYQRMIDYYAEELKKKQMAAIKKTRRKGMRPNAAGRRTAVDPKLKESFEAKSWTDTETDNILDLVCVIAEQESAQDALFHRSVTCNHCGMSPVRGWRYKCANCVDYDVCSACEELGVHFKTHSFIKIKISIPPQANPRSMIFPPFYPGIPWITSPSFDTTKLEKETKCTL